MIMLFLVGWIKIKKVYFGLIYIYCFGFYYKIVYLVSNYMIMFVKLYVILVFCVRL